MESLLIFDTKGDREVLGNNGDSRNTKFEYDANKRSVSKSKRLSNVESKEKPSKELLEHNDFDDIDISDIVKKALENKESRKNVANNALQQISKSIDGAAEARNLRKKLKYGTKPKKLVDLDQSDFNEKTGKFDVEMELRSDVQHVLDDSLMKPGFEKLNAIPNLTDKKQRELNRLERAKTKGKNWFNLPATEQTEEVKNDLRILQMRSVLDPKHFYKKNDLKVLPKYFQIGTVQHSPLDYYSERNSRKNKKKSIVEEMLTDNKFQNYTKRKYNEIIARKNKYAHRKAMKKMKQMKRQKK